ncbi:MAG: efflux RND transporter periplasmic adaptor subunit [Firmicutes bacterium]|nr:efflux RND transporter periplasmic adaptor subunit [Bacillota bacterium]
MSKLKTKKTLWIVIAIITLLSTGTVFWISKQSDVKDEETQYEQVKANRGDIIVGFDSDGNIDFSKVNLRFDVRGTINEILVSEGDMVEKGDVIAKLDSQDYQDQYQLALANLEDAQEQKSTNLLNDELTIKKAENELQQLKDEYEEMEAIPEAYPPYEIKLKASEIEIKELEYRNLLKEQEQLENQELTQDELQVNMAREDLEDTILYSPASGVVLGLSKKAGESVTDEEDFVTVHENNKVRAITEVIEYDVGQLRVGQKTYVTVEALPDQKFVGKVSKIDSLPTSDSSGLVNYSVEISVENPIPQLKDGMTGMVSFIRKEVTNCLIVPYKAVKMVNGKQVVTVVNENGQMTEKEIMAGFTDGNSVEVLEGLKGNETVVYPRGG